MRQFQGFQSFDVTTVAKTVLNVIACLLKAAKTELRHGDFAVFWSKLLNYFTKNLVW